MTRTLSILLASAVSLMPATLSAGYSNAFVATAISPEAFEIVSRFSPGSASYWCGAAQYAVLEGKPANASIYVLKGREDRRVTFGFESPTKTPVNSPSISVELVGNSLSVVQAEQYCYDRNIKD